MISFFTFLFFSLHFVFLVYNNFVAAPCPLTRHEEKGNLRQQTLDSQHEAFEYLEVRIVGLHEVLH